MTELPEPKSHLLTFTYELPNVLVSQVNDNGLLRREFIEGKRDVIEAESMLSFARERPTDAPFVVTAFNFITILGQQVSMLNDALPEFGLLASVPSASEYLALRGTRVLIGENIVAVHPELALRMTDSNDPLFAITRHYYTFP